MGLGRVTDHVDHLHDGIDGGIEADREVGTGDVVVDGAGDADAVDAFMRERLGAAEGTVTADDDDAFDTETAAHVRCLLLAAVGHEFHASGGAKDRTAALDDIGNAAQVHLRDVTGHQAFIAVVDADHTHIVLEAGTDDGTDCCIHARGVAAAGENTDRFHRSTSMGVNLIVYTYILSFDRMMSTGNRSSSPGQRRKTLPSPRMRVSSPRRLSLMKMEPKRCWRTYRAVLLK